MQVGEEMPGTEPHVTSPEPHVGKVARAIFEANPYQTFRWDELPSNALYAYYDMAQAAIGALDLPVLWGAAIPLDGGGFDANANVCHSKKDAQKLLSSLNRIYPDDRRCIVSRFGSGPWVASPLSSTGGAE
jgi:hypothetical protein